LVVDKLDKVIDMLAKIKIQPTEVTLKKKPIKTKLEQEPQENSKELDMSRFNPAPVKSEPLDLNALIPEMNEEYAITRTN
jgi:hypothetical protein